MSMRLLFLLPFFLLAHQSVEAAKTDIVILTNGDRLTGEIKKLEAGLLQYSTDTMGTVNIEWRFIAQVISDKTQAFETVEGQRWLGKLQKPEGQDRIEVLTVTGPITLDPDDVVSGWPVKASFWDKIDLDVGVGLDYSKATDIANFTMSADFLYRTERRIVEGTMRSDVTRQSNVADQNRQELRLANEVLLEDRRFRSWNMGLDSNDALGLQLRIFGGATYGTYLRKTNQTWFRVALGAIATEERPVDGERNSSVEMQATARYRHFMFASPERSVDTTLSVYPSLTESGRIRSDLRSTFKLELIEDLFWSMEFYLAYDSDPIDVTAEQTDWGLTTSVGWSF